MPYQCSLCEYTSTYKKDILKHFEKKKKCYDDEKPKIVEIPSNIKCSICDKKFANNNSLNRHLEGCKNRRNLIKIKELEDKVTELNTKLASTKMTGTTNITNNNTTNNTQINNYITISLTPYNDPNMQGMQQYLEAAIRKTFLSVPTLIESVHFNNEYPENQNICITNRRTKDARVFDGKKWKTISKDLLINEMVDTYERELTSYAEEQGKTKFIKEYESAKKRGGNGEKDLKEEVHNVIYDNSEMVNTKIKEVQKPIRRNSTHDLLDEESENETEKVDGDDSESSESGSEHPDEYEEFRKKFDDDSEPEESGSE